MHDIITFSQHFEQQVRGFSKVAAHHARPEAALISYEEFTRFLAWQEQELLQEFDLALARLVERNAAYGDDEIAADVEAAIGEVRAAAAKR